MLQLIPISYLILVTPSLCYWDFTARRLPNRFTLSAILLAFLAVIISQEWIAIAYSIALSSSTFLLGVLISKIQILGMGDVKLLTGMALMLGYFGIEKYFFAILIGMLMATAIAVYLLLTKKATRNSTIALGPYLLIGFIVQSIDVFRGFITAAV